jgi:hypothetical protein
MNEIPNRMSAIRLHEGAPNVTRNWQWLVRWRVRGVGLRALAQYSHGETGENRETPWRQLALRSGLELCASWPRHQTVRFVSDAVSGQAGWWVNNECERMRKEAAWSDMGAAPALARRMRTSTEQLRIFHRLPGIWSHDITNTKKKKQVLTVEKEAYYRVFINV